MTHDFYPALYFSVFKYNTALSQFSYVRPLWAGYSAEVTEFYNIEAQWMESGCLTQINRKKDFNVKIKSNVYKGF